MYIRRLFILLITSLLLMQFTGCVKSKKNELTRKRKDKTGLVIDTVRTDTIFSLKDQELLPVLYQQRSGEYRGLCYQSFQLAKLLVLSDLKDPSVNSQRAVIVDIDETVLDNSPFEAGCLQGKTSFPQGWNEWVSLAKAEPLPGAVEFLKALQQYRVEVFYVTNRTEDQKDATRRNLQQMGFPVKDEDHLLMKTDLSSKEPRRDQIAEHYHITLLMGDNLNDFSRVFENRSPDGRIKATDSLRAQFGKRFILLPNVMYGDWESAIINYDSKLSDKEKRRLLLQNLKGY
ncbi:MAG: 5'-nucleotidase, lipoprotein e(P4) family [Bacteroidetes bacterium]|nr:5'-nucleotidase, lipoprotein e(P4) family [Bacteroidota bacterium]